MSLASNSTPVQAIRCGDRNHKADIARQRARSTYNPAETADALIKIVRHRLSCGQSLEAAYFAGLQDDIWAILCDRLSSDELREVNLAAAGGIGVYDPVDVQTSDVAASHIPTWQDVQPTLTHHLQWIDSEGLQHGLTIRTDTLDDLVKQLTAIKALIASAKHQAQARHATASEAAQPQAIDVRQDWCRVHDCAMKQRGDESKGYWYSHKGADGKWCRGQSKA